MPRGLTGYKATPYILIDKGYISMPCHKAKNENYVWFANIYGSTTAGGAPFVRDTTSWQT